MIMINEINNKMEWLKNIKEGDLVILSRNIDNRNSLTIVHVYHTYDDCVSVDGDDDFRFSKEDGKFCGKEYRFDDIYKDYYLVKYTEEKVCEIRKYQEILMLKYKIKRYLDNYDNISYEDLYTISDILGKYNEI